MLHTIALLVCQRSIPIIDSRRGDCIHVPLILYEMSTNINHSQQETQPKVTNSRIKWKNELSHAI